MSAIGRRVGGFPLGLGMAVFLFATAIGTTLFAVFQEHVPALLGVSDAWGGYLLGAYGAARFLCETPTGALSDRAGRRSSLLVGLAVVALALGLVLAAAVEWAFLAGAGLLGIGSAFVWPSTYALAADLYGSDRRGKVVGFLNVAQVLGFGLGALLGALLVEQHADATRAIAVLAALLALLPAARLPGGSHSVDHARPVALREALSRQLALLCLLVLIATIGTAMVVPAIRPYGEEQLGISFARLTIALIPAVLLGAAASIPAGHLADRRGRTLGFLFGQFLLVLGLLAVAETRTLWIAVVGAAVTFVGSSVTVPAFNAAIMDLAPPEHRGTLIGLTVAVGGLALAVGPVIGGQVASTAGAPAVFRTAALVAAVTGVSIWLYARSYREGTVATEP